MYSFLSHKQMPASNCVGGVMRRLLRFSKTGASRQTHPDRCLMSSLALAAQGQTQTNKTSLVCGKRGCSTGTASYKAQARGVSSSSPLSTPHTQKAAKRKRLVRGAWCVAYHRDQLALVPAQGGPCPGSRQPIFRPPRRPLISYTLPTTRHVVPVDVCLRLALFWGTAGRRGDKTDSLLSLPASCLLGGAPRWR